MDVGSYGEISCFVYTLPGALLHWAATHRFANIFHICHKYDLLNVNGDFTFIVIAIHSRPFALLSQPGFGQPSAEAQSEKSRYMGRSGKHWLAPIIIYPCIRRKLHSHAARIHNEK